jgi:hypothetical protein
MIAFAKSQEVVGWQEGFLLLLPRIERYARRAFCNMRGDARDEAVCEVIAGCVCSYKRLFERNELHRAFASTLVRFAVRVYYRGKRVGTSRCSRGVYTRSTHRDATFELSSIGTPRNQRAEWMECLTDNHSTPIPDQVHFRIEFPRWLLSQTSRNRQIVKALSLGYTTAEVAAEFRISPGRVSQLRRLFHDSWNNFNGEAPSAPSQGHRIQRRPQLHRRLSDRTGAENGIHLPTVCRFQYHNLTPRGFNEFA